MTNKTFAKSFFLFLICFSFFKGFSQSPKKGNQKINYSKISVSEAKKIGLPTIDETNSLKLKTTSYTKKGASSNRKKMPNGIKAKSLNAGANPQISINSLKPNKITIPKYKASSSKTTSTKGFVKGKNYKQLSVRYSKKKIPKFISSEFIGEISNVSKKGRNIIIKEYLEELKEILMISSPSEEFEIKEENIDKLGLSHIKFEQVFNNIPVYAKEIIVHLDKRGIVKSLNGSYIATPEGISTDPKLNPKIIIDKLPKIFDKSLLELKKHNEAIEPNLVIYEKNDQLFLSWHITIYSSQLDRWNLFVDDKTGEILDKIYTTCTISPDHNHDKKKPKNLNRNKENKKLATGTGVDLNGVQRDLNTFFYNNTYLLIDITKSSYDSNLSSGIEQKGSITTNKYNPSDGYLYVGSSNDNTFDDPSLVSAHYNASLVYDYFLETHDRTSIDGRGGTVISMTNLKDENGDDDDNATWNGRFMSFGNGRVAFKPLAGALDVVAHEFTHGVVEWTAGLEYRDESGALNESFSDVFGLMLDRDDWTLGEDIVNNIYFPNGCLRSSEEPELGNQPSHYDDYVVGGAVHTNSGIPNKAFYLIASQMGREKAEQIYYRTLTTYLTKSSDFLDLRIGLEQSAIDIYGSNSAELTIVKQAFDSVGILFEQIEEEDRIEVEGTDYILSYDTDPDNTTTFYASDPFGDEFLPLSETKTWSRPSISSDGFFLVFVTEDNNLNGMSLIENNIFEYTIDDTGVWNTVAISKDKSKIALTTVNEGDKNIYVYDLKNDKWGTFELYTPTTAQGGLKSDQIVYADALEWDNRSERIIFDQLNRIKRGDTEDLEYWDIGIMDVWNSEKNKFASGSIIRLYSQIPDNVNIGFPSFAKTTNNVVAFDYIEQIDGEYYPYVVLLDIETSEFGFFESNSSDWAVPNFATLDNQIIYNQLDSSGMSGVYSRQVDDMILPSDQETLLISYADWGLWFNQGQRDFDKDGVLDDIDKCPNSPEGAQVDDDGCAVSQKDTDQDGINDDTDNCIETPNPDQLDTDGDGIGDECDEDDDGDGVEDERDLCPSTPIDSIVDLNGCKIFSLPVNNYSISVAEVSCAGENDGLITFSVEDKTYDYIATISNKSSSKRHVNSSKNALSCTPSISFVGSNVQTVGQGESAEQVTFVVTNTCSTDGSQTTRKLYYNGQDISLAENPFENYSLNYIAARGNNKGKLCDGTFSCLINSEPDTSNTIIFNAKVKEDAVLGEYMLIDNTTLSDNSQYSITVTITVVAGSTMTTTSTNSGNSTDTSSTGESIQLNSSNNHSGNFKNLEPGAYDICLKVIGEDGYEQCFELMVKEPQPLSASSKIDKTAKSVQFNLSGSRFYYIYHNDELKVVESNNPTIKLKSGLNFIKISTDKSCQGTYSEEFFISEKVEYYPNPTINNVYFYIHGEDEFVDITVVDATGNLYKNCVEEIPSSRKIELNFGDFYKGVYVVRLKGKTLDKTIKIIKE